KIANAKLNLYIKEVAKLAPMLQDVVEISSTKAGVRNTIQRPKWELVQTHTARRSFATNSHDMGVDSYSIMAVTNHRSEKAFLRYIKTSKKQHAERLRKVWNAAREPQLKAV